MIVNTSDVNYLMAKNYRGYKQFTLCNCLLGCRIIILFSSYSTIYCIFILTVAEVFVRSKLSTYFS